MAASKRKHKHKAVRKDKKLLELEKKYAAEVRGKHMHVEQRINGQDIIIAAVPNAVRAAPFVPNVKGMRWQDGQLVPRKGGPR